MKFWDYTTHFTWGAKIGMKAKNPDEFNRLYLPFLDELSMKQTGLPLSVTDPFTPKLMGVEAAWQKARRPYFNVWPSIIPALIRLPLDVDAGHFRLPVDHLLIRLPVDKPHPLRFTADGKEWVLRNVLAENSELLYRAKPGDPHHIEGYDKPTIKAISYHMDIGEEIANTHGLVSRQYKHLITEPGRSIEWSFDHVPVHESVNAGVAYPEQFNKDVARLICTLCLMAGDASVVEPDVLAADLDKYEQTHDPKFVDKAHSRGKVGWHVGRDIEVSPHYRSACPAALYWTGEGRKVPKIRFRRGSVVHRKRLASVPTGFLDDEGERK